MYDNSENEVLPASQGLLLVLLVVSVVCLATFWNNTLKSVSLSRMDADISPCLASWSANDWTEVALDA